MRLRFRRRPKRMALEHWAVLMSNGREVSSRTPHVLMPEEYGSEKPLSFAWIEHGATITHLRVIDADGRVTDLPIGV